MFSEGLWHSEGRAPAARGAGSITGDTGGGKGKGIWKSSSIFPFPRSQGKNVAGIHE